MIISLFTLPVKTEAILPLQLICMYVPETWLHLGRTVSNSTTTINCEQYKYRCYFS